MKALCIFLLILFTLNSFGQNCTLNILEADTSICRGSSLRLNAVLKTENNTCNTYSLNASLQNALLGWFPFCGNTNDIGPEHNNAVPFGPLTFVPDRFSNPNAAIRFTGSGESVHTNKIDHTTTNTFTYVTWVKAENNVTLPQETINPASGYGVDLSSTCVIHATHGYSWVVDHNNTGAGLMVATNGVFVLEHTDGIVPTPLVWQGNLTGWHSVAIVYDNHLPKLYIDGKYTKSGLVTPYIVHPSMGCDSVYLGTYPYITSGFGKGFNPSGVFVPQNNFKGSIDDIKIYGRALSDNELMELYQKDVYRLAWNTGDTTFQINVTPDQSRDYWVNALDGLCSDTIHVRVIDPPSFTLGGDTTLCNNNILRLSPSLPTGSYLWNTGSLFPSIYVSTSGLYWLQVALQGCLKRDSIKVQFEECDCRVNIPTAFTPDNNGLNDYFKPLSKCPFLNFEMKIFNRWGQLVFSTGNAQAGWDGRFAMYPQPPGTYVWYMTYKDPVTGILTRQKGTVVLLR